MINCKPIFLSTMQWNIQVEMKKNETVSICKLRDHTYWKLQGINKKQELIKINQSCRKQESAHKNQLHCYTKDINNKNEVNEQIYKKSQKEQSLRKNFSK